MDPDLRGKEVCLDAARNRTQDYGDEPLIHHRAQLGVYLRVNDIPIPGMYGPSADTKPAF